MGEEDVRAAAGGVVAALREAGRSEGTIRRYQAVLDRFAAFLAGRGLSTASDQVCVDFIQCANSLQAWIALWEGRPAHDGGESQVTASGV